MQTSKLSTQKFEGSSTRVFDDSLAIEEPLEIRLDYANGAIRRQKSVSITMRTPGSDRELAVGFLFTEGLIQSPDDVLSAEPCGPKQNVLKVTLADNPRIADKLPKLDRNFYTTSSCGVCGKSSIEALKTENQFTNLRSAGPAVMRSTLLQLPNLLRRAQATFDMTGGLHACGLFTEEGRLVDTREDVGRHNALDKLIGHAFLADRLPLEKHILMLSGRISFELVQKASMAGFKFVAAVGAPSSLAVELANEMDMTLVGFLRGETFNLYTGHGRLA